MTATVRVYRVEVAPWWTLRAVRARNGRIDSPCPTRTLCQRTWWPGGGMLPPSGKQGTPVRFRDGPAAVIGRSRPAAIQPLRLPRNDEFRAAARRLAVGRARESEDLPGFGSLPDREGGMADTAARAAGDTEFRTRCQPPVSCAPGVPRHAGTGAARDGRRGRPWTRADPAGTLRT